MDDIAAAARAWAIELTERPSVNGTADEAAFGPWLAGRIAERLPAEVWTVALPGDPRVAVAALRRGSGAQTALLTGHYDTVRTEDYGELMPLACRPEPLRRALLERLRRRAATVAETLALRDLESGAFLPGRGLLDMKGGLAAGLAALEAWDGQDGNLLFLAVPDEEASSAGARAAARALPAMLDERGLVLVAAINLDSLVTDDDGAAGRCVALGTVGKLLPSALVIGRPAHAAEALRGLNAGALAAAIVTEMEWTPELTDGEAAPPTLLGLGDHRAAYDVTMPDRVWAYWNVMTLERSPAAVLDRFEALCRRSLAKAATELAARGGQVPTELPVVRFEALREEADESAVAAVARAVAAQGLDLPEQCRRITEAAWAASGRQGPAVVIGLASLPYLPTRLQGPSDERLRRAVERAAAKVAVRQRTTIGTRPFFPGISDMSFLGRIDEAAVPLIAANTPAWGHGIAWPAGAAALSVPAVNIGPWGRDYHTPLERLHVPYAFEVLPELLLATVAELFASKDRSEN